ncbi:MAG TPA: helix-turn-helix domain-containing protein [Actinophytocola sp.]|uniref:TetR/AcrR family transcriptional regulator n=1 Tax=Actinophytocola sp. TaxID=1872138 RepID=UPI002DDD5289|nr:helix-turn-helix domain-containing protein [Actinophytocola sp.]HEV2779283.1 helix-turn-helix domain-containing protein [Actinophytocola sp.]
MAAPDASALLDLVMAGQSATDTVAETILDAALDEFLAYGLRRTNVDAVAKRAGVSRATLYRRFDGKDALVQAVLVRECHRFFTSIVAAIGHLPTMEERLVEGFVIGVRHARTHPLMNRLMASDSEALLPYLTVNGALVVAVARDFLVQQGESVDGPLPSIAGRTPAGVAELFVRLAISFTLTPHSAIPLDTDTAVRAFARNYLAPLMRP